MAKKLSFDAYLGWVNITNPNQIPADARVIGANDLLRYEKLGKDTAEKFAEVDTTLNGLKSDAVISDLIADAKSETRYAVDNMVKDGVTLGVAKFQKVIDEVPAKVTEQVTKVIAEDNTVAVAAGEAAGRAVEAELQEKGVVTGRASVEIDSPFIWRHTTDGGHYLPLGYDKNLHLDEHARRIWMEDINNAELVSEHPTYAKAITTENHDLLVGIRWDGGVDIPGLNAGGQSTTPSAPLTFYNDMPYQPDSDIMPSHADHKTWAIWGSSSAGGIQGNLKFSAEEMGIGFYSGGQGGERSYHIAARLGSIPARLTFPDNKVPGSGEVIVTSSNLNVANSLKTYAGYVVAKDGRRIFGQMARSADATPKLIWTRSGTGELVEVDADVEFVPTDGKKYRNATTFLWMGKNNTFEPDRVIRETDKSFEYLASLNKRCMVLGHFVNTGQAADSASRTQIAKINGAHAARFGRAYYDVNEYLTSGQLWDDTKITPTEEDLREQALGNKPPSISADAGHMNGAGYMAVRDQLLIRLNELGWITSAQGN